jgi:glutathione synthase
VKKRRKPAKRASKGQLHLLWVIDPWETLDHPKDTTLRLCEEAIAMGARCFLAENRAITLVDGVPSARVTEIIRISRPRTSDLVVRAGPALAAIRDFDHVFYRTDPPVDLTYLLPLQILAAAEGTGKSGRPRIHSTPDSLFRLNEKWVAARLPKRMPKSLVSASPSDLAEFALRLGRSVLKPLYLAQSKGVRVLEKMDRSALESLFDQATENGKMPVILQEYLPGIARGETRLWFAGAKLIAAIRKIPKSGESIIDMDAGASLGLAKLTAVEKAASREIAALLRKERILFAAVDLIDGKITDFNHTSPGLLGPMEELTGENLARKALAPIFR